MSIKYLEDGSGQDYAKDKHHQMRGYVFSNKHDKSRSR